MARYRCRCLLFIHSTSTEAIAIANFCNCWVNEKHGKYDDKWFAKNN
jgi:hypothetical protein